MPIEAELVDGLVDQLLAEHPPAETAARGVSGGAVRPGAGLGALPGGRRRPGPQPRPAPARCWLGSSGPGRRSAGFRNLIGYGMVAPTLVAHGTEDQQQRYLRPLFTGEEIWCQLFSEPGAGSDVASLATRAVADGDEWVVNGQKVWTTVAHLASFGLLLARTDPDQPKHRGMTCFLVDMHASGRRGPSALPDDRGGRVQRGVLHRRRGARWTASVGWATAGGWRSPP